MSDRVAVPQILYNNEHEIVPIEFFSKLVFILKYNGNFKEDVRKLIWHGFLHSWSHLYGWMEVSDLDSFGINKLWIEDRTGFDPRVWDMGTKKVLLNIIGARTIVFAKGMWLQEVESIYQMTSINGGQNFGTHYSPRFLKKKETPPAFAPATSTDAVRFIDESTIISTASGGTLISRRVES